MQHSELCSTALSIASLKGDLKEAMLHIKDLEQQICEEIS